MDKIEYALKIFKLDVKEMYEVSESYSSTVRILQLENGEKLVLKLPYNQSKLMREESVLKLLSQNTLVPDLIDTWYGDDSHNGALLMTYIDGDPMLSTDDDGLIYQAGKILAELHEVKLETFELDEKNDDWWGSLKQRFDRWMEEIIGFIPKDIFLASQDYFTRIVEKSQSVDGPRLTHFDFRPGNLLVKDHQIVGLIDFESSRGGSVDIDFTKIAEYIWKENPRSKEIFLQGYRSVREIPDIENHLPIYEFFNAVGGIAWCVRRDKLQDNFYDENLKVIKACLAKIDKS